MGNQTDNADHRDTTGWSATTYNKVAPYVYSPEATAPILQSLGASPGDRILDLGCGSGEITAEIMRLVEPEGVVVGVDLSESMVGHRWLLILSLHADSMRRSRRPVRQPCFRIHTSS
jgi:SAM-dependent methyltransferase